MYTKVESNSDMPISNTAFTGYPLMRGAVPKGVDAPRGVMSVKVSPACSDRDSARRRPMATPSPVVEFLERALPDVAGDMLDLAQVLGAHAAHQNAAAAILRRAERLPLHQRHGALHAGHRRDALAATS